MAVAILGSGSITGLTGGGAPGLEYITSSTFNAVASVSINNCFTSTYTNYCLIMRMTSTDNVALRVRMRAASVDDTQALNHYQYIIAANTAFTGTRLTNQTSVRIASVNTPANALTMQMYNPAEAVPTEMTSSQIQGGTLISHQLWAGEHAVSTAYDGFTLFPDSGTMTGSLYVYGYRKT